MIKKFQKEEIKDNVMKNLLSNEALDFFENNKFSIDII